MDSRARRAILTRVSSSDLAGLLQFVRDAERLKDVLRSAHT